MENTAIGALTLLAIDVLVMFKYFQMTRGIPWGKHKEIYMVTKTLLIPLIAAFYYFQTTKFNTIIGIYLFGHWVGDVILLCQSKMFTAIGALGFLFGHIAIIKAFGIDWEKVEKISLIVPTIVIVVQLCCIIPVVDVKDPYTIAMVIYVSVLAWAEYSACARSYMLGFFSLKYWIGVIGYTFFLFSDTIIILSFLTTFKHRRRPLIMGTYIFAQLCLVWTVME